MQNTPLHSHAVPIGTGVKLALVLCCAEQMKIIHRETMNENENVLGFPSFTYISNDL